MRRNIPSDKLDLTSKEKGEIIEFVRIFGDEDNKTEMRRDLEYLLHNIRRSTKYQIKKAIK